MPTQILHASQQYIYTKEGYKETKWNNENIEVMDSKKLIGKNLKWDFNSAAIVRKANARME